MKIIYSDDPRGIKKAMKEESEKGFSVRLRDKKFKPKKKALKEKSLEKKDD